MNIASMYVCSIVRYVVVAMVCREALYACTFKLSLSDNVVLSQAQDTTLRK